MAFNPHPNASSLMIDHIDGNKVNNCVENLRWVTDSENNTYARQQRTFVDNSIKREVDQYTPDVEFVARFPSITAASIVTGVSFGTISDQCKNPVRRGRVFWWCFSIHTVEINGIRILPYHVDLSTTSNPSVLPMDELSSELQDLQIKSPTSESIYQLPLPDED